MLNLLLAAPEAGAVHATSYGTIIIMIVMILAWGSFPFWVCYLIGRHKNLSAVTTLLGFLFILGIIIALVLPANYVQCKNCGMKFNPRKTHICPTCGLDIKANVVPVQNVVQNANVIQSEKQNDKAI